MVRIAGVGFDDTAADDTATAAAAIEREMERWLVAYEAQDAEALADLFMENGIYAANTGQVFRGRADMRQGVAAWFTNEKGGSTKRSLDS